MTIARNRRIFLLALLLATASAFLAYRLVSSWPHPEPTVVEVRPEVGEPVLLGARTIPAGTTITADDIEVGYVAPTAREERALTESEQVIGSVSLVSIPKGEQILASSIGALPTPQPKTFAQDVPVGLRAVTIALEETVGVGGLVQPGDRVDVIASYELKPIRSAPSLGALGDIVDMSSNDDDSDPFPVAELLLQDVQVLAIGQALDATTPAPPPDDAKKETSGEGEGPAPRPDAASVTLLVNPTEALRLLLAVESEAIFRLLLRSPGDTTVTELPPAFITSGGVMTEPFSLLGANLANADMVITGARFRQTSVPAGGILEFEATVRNVSSHLIPAGRGGASSGHVYHAGETWQSVDEQSPAGVYSVGVTSENAQPQSYPWRWELAEDLAPGQTATITGGIQVPNDPGVQRWWFGTMLQPGTVLEDGVAPVEITIEPISSIEVTAPEIELRDSPWSTSPSLVTMSNGSRADVLDYQEGWFLVRSGKTDGWIPEDAVTNTALLPTTDSPQTAQSRTEEST
jgi:pilus assembly protein CpaB